MPAATFDLLPVAFLDGAAGADNHFVEALRQREARPGRYIERERGRYHIDAAGPRIYTFAGEALALEAVDVPGLALLSLRGRFASADRVVVERTTFTRGVCATSRPITELL